MEKYIKTFVKVSNKEEADRVVLILTPHCGGLVDHSFYNKYEENNTKFIVINFNNNLLYYSPPLNGEKYLKDSGYTEMSIDTVLNKL